MSEDRYTPSTHQVRDVYENCAEHRYGAEFDRWLAKVVEEAFDSGSKAGVEYGVALQKIYNF
jgi:hypothetical protein